MTTLPDTPFARVDRAKAERNIARLRAHLDALGVTWRPHVKTSKALEPTAMIFDGLTGPITVSTLTEAEFFADAGYADILYPSTTVSAARVKVTALAKSTWWRWTAARCTASAWLASTHSATVRSSVIPPVPSPPAWPAR